MNVTTSSRVKVLGRWVAVPNWVIFERKRWSPERIARVEAQAARLGAMQTAVVRSWAFPVAVVLGAYAALYASVWAVETAVAILL